MKTRVMRLLGWKNLLRLLILVLVCYGVFLLAQTFLVSSGGRRLGGAQETFETGAQRLEADLLRLSAFSAELEHHRTEMILLQESFGRRQRGYFTSDEHDKIESLLFRYLVCRESLWDMVDYYRDYETRFSEPEEQTKAFIIGFNAALHLAHYGSVLVATFLDEPVVIEKLNEAYHRSGIPKGTYDEIFTGVTSIDNIEALKTAWELYSNEAANPDSLLSRVARGDPAYGEMAGHLARLHENTDVQVETILTKRSLLLPDVRNRIRNSAITERAKMAYELHNDNLYAVRAVLFLKVSRLRSPAPNEIVFSARQLREIKSLLEPGDIILTFKSGYMSNIFLPGVFKHGMTYVGSPSQRKEAGLDVETLTGIVPAKKEKLARDLARSHLAAGAEADVIEAVAEGVIFNSIEQLMNTDMNRLLVLRPKLTREERIEDLKTVFLLLGSGYDFKFDFNDARYQCCTEVIYRSLNARGDIRFPLTKRMGIQTLSADDILNYHLSSDPSTFEFVFLAEESPRPKTQRAVILTGEKGVARFRELMTAAETEKSP
jgi:hypothetical protein